MCHLTIHSWACVTFLCYLMRASSAGHKMIDAKMPDIVPAAMKLQICDQPSIASTGLSTCVEGT